MDTLKIFKLIWCFSFSFKHGFLNGHPAFPIAALLKFYWQETFKLQANTTMNKLIDTPSNRAPSKFVIVSIDLSCHEEQKRWNLCSDNVSPRAPVEAKNTESLVVVKEAWIVITANCCLWHGKRLKLHAIIIIFKRWKLYSRLRCPKQINLGTLLNALNIILMMLRYISPASG